MENLIENNHLYRVLTYPNVFTPEECERILNLTGEDIPTAAKGVDPNLFPKCRDIDVNENNLWLYKKLDKVVQHANNNFYKFVLLGVGGSRLNEYKDGRSFDWHPDMASGKNTNRKLTTVIMLSNQKDFEGGNLKWWGIKHEFEQKQGMVVVFPTYIIHKVEPVTKGVRYSLVSWFIGPYFR